MLWVWRHPRPEGVEGRCIGHCDLVVPARRLKRLARRIQREARRHGLPQVVYTSPLLRCAQVGRQLRRWGWVHVIDPNLSELDFGAWDGRLWADIAHDDIDRWCREFADHAPGDGESLATLLARAKAWKPAEPSADAVLVGHAGWMLARRWTGTREEPPAQASQWPSPPSYGALWCLE